MSSLSLMQSSSIKFYFIEYSPKQTTFYNSQYQVGRWYGFQSLNYIFNTRTEAETYLKESEESHGLNFDYFYFRIGILGKVEELEPSKSEQRIITV